MIVYDIHSWHYRLILWTWGKHFFEESEIDYNALKDMRTEEMTKLSWEELPRKYKSKTVNFCPYCRAMVGAVITSPFVYLWRLLPHKKKEPLTREGIKKAARRRTIMMLSIVGTVNGGIAVKNLYYGEYYNAAIQIGIVAFIFLGFKYSEKFGKAMVKLVDWIAKHRKPKVKVKKVKAPKKPSKLRAKLAEKHDIYCPPVHFIDKSKPEEHI